LVILLLIGHCPGLRFAGFDHLGHSGRRVVGWLTFWLDNLCIGDLLWPGVGMIKAAGWAALDRWCRIWLRVGLPVTRVAEHSLEEPHDWVLRCRDDLMYLRRDQTRAVEEILGDLRANAERHLGVLHHLD
jgi:hypothetical protein